MTDWIQTGAPQPHTRGGPACSTASRLLDEDLTATASLGERWLLVEVAGAWGWNAWTQSPVLPPHVGRALARRAHDAGMRIAAIRRPGRARGPVRWRWAVVDTVTETVRWGEADDAPGLLAVPLDGSTGTPSTEPVFLVCAHGRHDECCAVRGRAAAARLAAAYPDATWECSHIGGDRFAATMLLFPHGLSYGRIDDHDPVRTAEAYLAGEVAPDGYRGRVTYPHPEQAALAAAAERSGDRRVNAYRPVEVVEAPDDELRVVLEHDSGRRVVVRLGVRVLGPVLTTCRATVPVEVRRFAVLDVR